MSDSGIAPPSCLPAVSAGAGCLNAAREVNVRMMTWRSAKGGTKASVRGSRDEEGGRRKLWTRSAVETSVKLQIRL
jgi:hypothetical protein